MAFVVFLELFLPLQQPAVATDLHRHQARAEFFELTAEQPVLAKQFARLNGVAEQITDQLPVHGRCHGERNHFPRLWAAEPVLR